MLGPLVVPKRTLKSFITPGALKTLSDFGKNQLGYNAIYKEELTK